MSVPNVSILDGRTPETAEPRQEAGGKLRPSLRWSDVRHAPLHDFPIRDEILRQYLPLTHESDVLEIGPGCGATAFWMVRQVRRLALVDVAAGSLAELRERFQSLPNVRCVHWDLSRPGLSETLGEEFDAAFGLDMFEYVVDPAACLRNLAAVLRPGGVLLLSFPNLPPPQGDGVTYFSQVEDLERLLGRAGFRRWEVFAVRLRTAPAVTYRVLHEWPLAVFRKWRRKGQSAQPQVYDSTWAFQQRKRMARYRVPLNLFWAALGTAMRLTGDIFIPEPLRGQALGRQLVVRAWK